MHVFIILYTLAMHATEHALVDVKFSACVQISTTNLQMCYIQKVQREGCMCIMCDVCKVFVGHCIACRMSTS